MPTVPQPSGHGVKYRLACVVAGQRVVGCDKPTIAVSFARIGTMLAAFTPRRWDLIAALRGAGPGSVRALAQQLARDDKNVHGDVAALERWMAVQRLPDGRVHVPWREIVVDMRLPDRLAARAAESR